MPSGGARARSGPPPDPNALRRARDGKEWRHLPATGRPGAPPTWPLGRATPFELALWKKEWARPQAIVWEEDRREVEVALYVRQVRRAQMIDAPAGVATALIRQQTELGLNITGRRAMRWEIDDDSEPGDQPADATTTGRPSARDRFAVITGKAG